jgi:hypothetical protein
MGTRLAATIACAVLVLTGATCSGDDDDAADDTSTTPTTESPEAEVEAAYLAFWDMAVRLAESPDPDDPEIAERSSGDARDDLVAGLTALRDGGQRTESGPATGHDVSSVQIDGDEAELEDCAVDESTLVDVATGDSLQEGTGTTLWRVTLLKQADGWMVDQFERLQVWEGDVACQ